LTEWDRQYVNGDKPNECKLRKQLNSIKHDLFPWMKEVPKSVPQQAVKNLGRAFQNFFEKRARSPRFKQKGKCRDSARFDNGPGTFSFNGKSIRLPVVGKVRMREELRFAGKPLSAVVSRTAGRWFVTVTVEVVYPLPVRENQAYRSVGVDLGLTTTATLSTGEKLDSPKPLRKLLPKFRRLSRAHSRKQQGSANRQKSAARLANLHWRISCIRSDWTHKVTTRIVHEFNAVAIEDLNVCGMLKNRRLSRAIGDGGWFEFRRQLAYKSELRGTHLHVVDRFFPSSKLCSSCGFKMESLPLAVRQWTCPDCGADHDRDVNGAENLRQALP
jgi:putative transposase